MSNMSGDLPQMMMGDSGFSKLPYRNKNSAAGRPMKAGEETPIKELWR